MKYDIQTTCGQTLNSTNCPHEASDMRVHHQQNGRRARIFEDGVDKTAYVTMLDVGPTT